MIPVRPAAEPAHFDRSIRQRGLSAIDELVGRVPRVAHPGRRRKKIAVRAEDIPPDAFPAYWRDALGDMLRAYERRCAYLALYIDHATGSPTVDHVVPKSRAWDKVYEWSNYRLCAALINSKKNALMTVLDPFAIKDGWFALELVAFQVTPGPSAPANRLTKIEKTIDDAGLNLPDCCQARKVYVEDYEGTHT
jgi:5-methylcytosine-specific restriction endonuclease McrA